MDTFMRIAWRNLWRNTRRTLLTCAAIAFSIFVTVNVVAMNDGCHWAMIRSSLDIFSGYLQIHKTEDPRITLEEIVDWPEFISVLRDPHSAAAKHLVTSLPAKVGPLVANIEPGKQPEYKEKLAILRVINSTPSIKATSYTQRTPTTGAAQSATGTAQSATGTAQSPTEKTLADFATRLRFRKELERAFPHSLAPLKEKSYQQDPLIEKCFDQSKDLEEILAAAPTIRAFTHRLQAGALVASEENSLGGLVVGVQPSSEAKVSTIARKVRQGKYLEDDDVRQCLVGSKLAEFLKVKLGDKIVVLTQALDGSTGAMKFKVKGIIRMGADKFEKSLVVVPIEDLRAILRAEGKVHSVVCALTSPDVVKQTVKGLKARIDESKLSVLGWPELVPELLQFIELDDTFGNLFLSVVLLVVIFGILSAVFTSVLERTHEFGLMLALGTRPKQVLLLVLLETILLSTFGTILGLSVGLPCACYFQAHPYEMPASSEDIWASYGLDENKIWFEVRPHKVLIVTLFMVGLATVFSMYPAWRAAALRPDQAMRTVNQ